MSKIKMVGLDLDGTLLNDRKEVTAYARDVICRCGCNCACCNGETDYRNSKRIERDTGHALCSDC